MSDEMNLPGQRLKAERTRKGLSEQDVAARLHLSMTYLRALEADDYDKLPEAAFVKGYVRNYARLLGMPAEELVNQFKALVADEQRENLISPVHTMHPSGKPFWLIPVLAIAIVAIIAVSWWVTRPDGTDVPQIAERPAEITVVPPDEPATLDDQAEVAVARDNPAPEMAPGTAVPEPEPVGEPPAVVSPSEPVIDRLQISFSAECWVEVNDAAGERLFQGKRDAGGTLSLRGEAPFSVTLGNAAAVARLQFNGETMSLPQGAPGRVVRISVP